LRSLLQEIKKTAVLALPISIGQLGHVLTGVADYTMLGHTVPLEMAGATFATSVFFPIMILGLGFSIGLTPLVAKANGAKDSRKVKTLFRTGFKLNLILGLLLLGVLLFFGNHLEIFNQPQEVVDVCLDYYYIISFSIIPLMLFQAFKQFVEGLQDTKTPMIISLLGNVINVILNYFLIFGWGGYEGMGIIGAGISTLIARSLMLFIFVAYFMKVEKLRALVPALFHDILELKYIKEILNIGLPISTYMFFEVTAFSAATFMMGWISEAHIAGHQVALSLASMSFVICMGVGNAGSIRSATLVGEKKIKEVRGVVRSVVFISLSLSLLFALVFFIFNEELPLIFVNESSEEIIMLASSMIWFAAIFQFSDGIQVIYQGLLQGIGDVKVPSLIAVASYWFIGLPFGCFLAFETTVGYIGIWIGLAVGLTISAVLQVTRYQFSYRKLLRESQF
jgi:MATE family multidrug resistance protein|tara:strand:+ start:6605 stop:7957 length:1353 start_codon:yes stop_codon:yes gene_type:complete